MPTNTILIAEDDPLIRKTTSHYLKANGYVVLEASDGREALHLFRENGPDLILTDLRMPELDGMQLVEMVVKENPQIPVIIFSGMGTMVDVIEALRIGAWDYLIKPISDLKILLHSITRALSHAGLLEQEKDRKIYLEQEIEKRTGELLRQYAQLEQEMENRKVQEALVIKAKREWERTIDAMPDMITIVDKDHRIVRANKTMIDKLETTYGEFLGTKCHYCAHSLDGPPNYCPHSLLLEDGKEHSVEVFEERLGGHCEIIVVPYSDADGILIGSVHIVRDINERKKVEREKDELNLQLLHAQKLEAVGQLASGIAHEINTPTQFVGSNIDFLGDAFEDIATMVSTVQDAVENVEEIAVRKKIEESIEEADWAYLLEEIPHAISQSKEGVTRVTSIVGAMKEFSHPGKKEKEPVQLSRIVETTVTVARNEWKYVADLETDFDTDMPPVHCLVDEMGQVILNILVNAAHAIEERLGDNPEGRKGAIHIRVRHVGSIAEIRISDNGGGIPEELKSRVFDPFFTTKEVGKGTGQGLAIARAVVVEKHDGTIEFESEPGEGSTFIIQLPLLEEETF